MVIAVDFDGTLCEDRWPEIGPPNYSLIVALNKAHRAGHKIILWTCRHGDMLSEAVEFCVAVGLEFDGINDRPYPDPDSGIYPEVPRLLGYQKVFADIYIDDRAMVPENFILVSKIFEKSIDKTGEM